MKLRPVLLLTGPMGNVPEVLVAYISSVIPTALLPSDILLDPTTPEHASTHLKTPSVLRLHKLATIHARSVVRLQGTTPEAVVLDAIRDKLGPEAAELAKILEPRDE